MTIVITIGPVSKDFTNADAAIEWLREFDNAVKFAQDSGMLKTPMYTRKAPTWEPTSIAAESADTCGSTPTISQVSRKNTDVNGVGE